MKRVKAAVVTPLLLLAMVITLVLTDVLSLDHGASLFWGMTTAVGVPFLFHYGWRSKFWRRRGFSLEIMIWSVLVVGSAFLATLTFFFGSDWLPRTLVRFVIAGGAFLAVWRRYALYLRTRHDADVAAAAIEAEIARAKAAGHPLRRRTDPHPFRRHDDHPEGN